MLFAARPIGGPLLAVRALPLTAFQATAKALRSRGKIHGATAAESGRRREPHLTLARLNYYTAWCCSSQFLRMQRSKFGPIV
jgi:hypothetical protein